MSHLWNLVKKELKELLTPSSLISVIVVTILFVAMGSFLGGETKDMTSLQRVGFIDYSTEPGPGETDYAQIGYDNVCAYYLANDYDPNEYVLLLSIESEYGTDAFNSELYDKMTEKEVDTVLVIMPNFNANINAVKQGQIVTYWNQTSLGIFSAISVVTSETAISLMDSAISADILKNKHGLTDDELKVAMNPCVSPSHSTFLKGTIHEGVTPDQIYSALNQQTMFVPIIIMLIIVMIGSIVISSMGNEKENKTLETLLTLPVSRITIVAGKLIGSTIAGLVMGVLYMIGMYFYINGISGATSSGVSIESLGLSLSLIDWVVVTAFMFLSIICALGICMILGALAKNYKAAQTYIMPISILAVIPMFVTMFSSIDSMPMIVQIFLFAIPFTHPMVIMQNLMFGNTLWIIGGAIYLVAFTLVTFYITVRIYNSDILITGLRLKRKKKQEDQEEEEIIG